MNRVYQILVHQHLWIEIGLVLQHHFINFMEFCIWGGISIVLRDCFRIFWCLQHPTFRRSSTDKSERRGTESRHECSDVLPCALFSCSEVCGKTEVAFLQALLFWVQGEAALAGQESVILMAQISTTRMGSGNTSLLLRPKLGTDTRH